LRPIVPRDLRLEMPERMDAQGRPLIPLDEDALRAAVEALRDAGCEALVIHFLHAYANPAHELRAGEIAREIWPNDHITLGHALLSESREFERGVTAAVNASVQPLLERYVARFAGALEERGYAGDLLVMNGNGGMVSARFVAREAAKTVMSGPATGVMAAAAIGRRAGAPNLITYDMGGTSTDVALIRDARPAVSNEIEVEYAMPIHVPMVDVRTVGAGGGSIARVDAAGLLRVGPESAGASPGPICYGRGGTEPTISDANLLLGRLNPDRLLAVEGAASVETIRAIFAEKLGAPLGVDAEDGGGGGDRDGQHGHGRRDADGLGLARRGSARFRAVRLRRRRAAPRHRLARELGAPRVLVPARPGLTNALGCVVADLRHDFVRTLNRPLDALDMGAVAAIFAEQVAEGRRLIGKERIEVITGAARGLVGRHAVRRADPSDPRAARRARHRRRGAARALRRGLFPPLPRAPRRRAGQSRQRQRLRHRRAPRDRPRDADRPAGRAATLEEAETGRRRVWFASGWRDTPVYARERLPLDAAIAGPAIVEQMDATTVIEPGDRAAQDADGNLLIEIGEG
jgi:N-methylhydantoinase A